MKEKIKNELPLKQSISFAGNEAVFYKIVEIAKKEDRKISNEVVRRLKKSLEMEGLI